MQIVDVEIEKKQNIRKWARDIVNLESDDMSKKVGCFVAGREILDKLDKCTEEHLSRAMDLSNNYQIDLKNASIYDIYTYNQLLSFINSEANDPIFKGIDESLSIHKAKDGLYNNGAYSSEHGEIYASNLLSKMSNYKNKMIDSEKILKEISKRKLSNGVFSDDIETKSNLFDTYYATKNLILLKSLDGYKSSIGKYVSSAENDYSKLSTYEKLMMLDLKRILNIDGSDDKLKVKSILDDASEVDLTQNSTLITFALQVANFYKLDTHDVLDADTINSLSIVNNNSSEISDDKILYNLMIYKLLYAVEDENAVVYKSLIENEYIEG